MELCSRNNSLNNIVMTLLLLGFIVGAASAQQCGSQAGGALCPNRLCCSRFGYCGDTDAYCGAGCQSQCRTNTPSPPGGGGGGGGDIASLMPRSVFDEFLKHRSASGCQGGFYTYDAFIAAAKTFPAFCNTGDLTTRKREIAAFFGQTSHETTGGWASAPDGPFAWGYCYIREINQAEYCTPSTQWPCASGQKYYGRGPIQLTHNYNYGPAGRALGLDLLNNPDQLATNAVTSFRAAIWFWMTPQGNKPSCHSVAVGQWTPSAADRSANRNPGYGVITNIINGGLECGRGPDSRVADRIGFYKRYCDILRIGYGDNLDCYNQRSF